jgi:hypothetical protein
LDPKMEKKINLISNLITEFRQWASDIEYIRAYQECKLTFDDILLTFEHPIWDDLRSQFKNYKHFLYYVTNIPEQNKEEMFNVLWNLSIAKIQEVKQKELNEKKEKRWYKLLKFAGLKEKDDETTIVACPNYNFFLKELKLTAEMQLIKYDWNKQFWFLNIADSKYKRSKAGKYVEAIWDEEVKEGPIIHNKFNKEFRKLQKDKENERILWTESDWWKKI